MNNNLVISKYEKISNIIKECLELETRNILDDIFFYCTSKEYDKLKGITPKIILLTLARMETTQEKVEMLLRYENYIKYKKELEITQQILNDIEQVK